MSPRRPTPRGRRVDEVLRQVISDALVGLQDPRLRLVTVTGVHATTDLAYADVFVQVHGNEHRREKALEALEASRALLQSRVNAELHIRRTPILRFEYDGSYDRGRRIEELLRDHRPLEEDGEG